MIVSDPEPDIFSRSFSVALGITIILVILKALKVVLFDWVWAFTPLGIWLVVMFLIIVVFILFELFFNIW